MIYKIGLDVGSHFILAVSFVQIYNIICIV